MTRRRGLRGAAGLLAGLLAGALALPATAGPAAASPHPASRRAHQVAANDPTDIAVRLTGVSPTTLTQGSTLSVTGEVRNTTSRTLGAVSVRIRLRPERLQTRAALAAWADGTSGLDDGPAVITVTVPGRLGPGARASFTARKPVDETFGLPGGTASFGPRAMTVEVVGAPVRAGTKPADDARLTPRPVGVRRTFTVWSPDRTPPTLRLGVVVPLVPTRATPDVSEPSVDTLADLAPTGRIGRLTGVASSTPGLTWAVDPALLLAAARAGRLDEEASTATSAPSGSPSSPVADDPTPTPSPTGSGGVDPDLAPYLPGAQEWLSTIRTSVGSQDVWALPFGDTDLVSLARANQVDLLRQARTAGAAAAREAVGEDLPTGLGLPADGVADRLTVDAASRAGFTDLVLAGSGQPSTGAEETAPPRSTLLGTQGATGVGGIVADDVMSAAFTRAGAGTDALDQQRLVADLAATARASLGGQPGSVVVTAPRGWQVDAGNLSQLLAALRSTTWLSVTKVSTLRTEAATRASARTPTYPPAEKASELPAAGVVAVAEARRRLTAFAPAIVDPDSLVVPFDRESLSLLGVPWRGAHDRFTARTTALTGRVDALYGSVRVPTGSGTLLLARTGDLPVTVENSLDHDVRVVLALRPRSGRLVVEEPVVVKVPAKAKTRALVPVRAIADGEVDVEVSLLTPDLHRIQEAPPIAIRVRSDWESRGITAVASALVLLLVVGLVRGIRRGRRPSVPLDAVPDPDDIGRVLVDDEGHVLAEARDVTPVGGIPVVTAPLPVDREARTPAAPTAPLPAVPSDDPSDTSSDEPDAEPADTARREAPR